MGLRRTKGGGTYKIQNQAALLQRREGRRCEEDGGHSSSDASFIYVELGYGREGFWQMALLCRRWTRT